MAFVFCACLTFLYYAHNCPPYWPESLRVFSITQAPDRACTYIRFAYSNGGDYNALCPGSIPAELARAHARARGCTYRRAVPARAYTVSVSRAAGASGARDLMMWLLVLGLQCASGAGRSTTAGSCAASTFLHNTQLQCTPGGNIVKHERVSSAAACCSLCTAYPGGACVAWAWSEHEGVGSCNLKNGTSCQSTAHAGTTAGILSPLPRPPPYKPPRSTPAGAHNVLFFAVDVRTCSGSAYV